MVLLHSGDVYTFGNNNHGQLGLGHTKPWCVCVYACVHVCVCACVCVCVHVGPRFDSWLSHFGIYCYFLEQETLLTLLHSTQLLNGDLVAWYQLGKQHTQLEHLWEPGVN